MSEISEISEKSEIGGINEISEVISARAPFPGGVGPITVSALFFNLSRLIQTN